jgi:endoglycosylceramidase
VLAAAARPAAAQDLRASDGRIVDADGRTVLLRGINVNQLAEYAQNHPGFPTTLPLTEADLAGIAAQGFDVVRLLVSWSRLEPTPGAFDTAYVEQVRQAIRWAAAHDVAVVVDMHQDAWGPAIGTPVSETCLPGFEPAIGWDGAPAWATITDGLPTCAGAAVRELSPAVAQAWTNFYLDRAGIQGHLVATWGRLAGALAAEPNMVGWDLLNEPHPGSVTIGTSDLLLLGRFHDRVLDAIRAAEAAAGVPPRIGFWEPGALWSLLGVAPVPLPGFTDQPNLVFAPHVYAGSLAPLVTPEQGHALAAGIAGLHGQPYWSGEWGWFGDPASDGPKVAAYAAEEDRRLVGGAWWSWKQACGDPHVIGGRGREPGAISPSLHRIGCPGDVDLGIPTEFGTVLSRSYPRAAPGALQALASDPATGAMQASGSAPGARGRAAELDLWVPDRGLGAPVVSGVEDVEVRAVPGGWRVTATATGDWSVTVAPAGPSPAPPVAVPAAVADGGATLPTTGGTPPLPLAAAVLLVLALRLHRHRPPPPQPGAAADRIG